MWKMSYFPSVFYYYYYCSQGDQYLWILQVNSFLQTNLTEGKTWISGLTLSSPADVFHRFRIKAMESRKSDPWAFDTSCQSLLQICSKSRARLTGPSVNVGTGLVLRWGFKILAFSLKNYTARKDILPGFWEWYVSSAAFSDSSNFEPTWTVGCTVCGSR